MSQRAVLFDMDGVIVDSEDYWVAAEREELLPAVVPDHDVAVSEVTGLNYREIYDYLEREYGTAVTREEFIERFEAVARGIYADRVALLEGFHGILADLEEREVPVAIVSSSPHDWIDVVRERFDLTDAFDAVVSAEGIDGPGKPDPYIYEHAAELVGVAPEDALAVEDSGHGVAAAAAAGVHTVAYRIAAHDNPDLSPADAVVDSPEELRKTVLAYADRGALEN
ncbi:HAD family hydrolase [Saliphagus infecundisoli]|uniref:HAD family hydrolase n=1 Tax=Saliphagus infecundisoli TaxID=1849069 RepID=A0ABD5QH69_9EURY|nr:HAD family phosphatase [Saliphagus infecundisoli]